MNKISAILILSVLLNSILMVNRMKRIRKLRISGSVTIHNAERTILLGVVKDRANSGNFESVRRKIK